MVDAVTKPDVLEHAGTSEVTENNRGPHRRPLWSRVKILVRRIHLYSGLFLLPWVFLYAVTGAMFNHQNLFPDVSIQHVNGVASVDAAMHEFPSSARLAQQVVDTLQALSGDTAITLPVNHRAEFTNEVMFEVNKSGIRHVVHIDPVSKASRVLTHPRNEESPETLLNAINNINLDPNPLDAAQASAKQILSSVGIESESSLRPFGWTKLNFLANVDGEPARVTYVLKDGHVDVTKYSDQDGMTQRHFLMRLHTSHGQPPHWNGRMFWSVAVDVMAIAMVCWGLTGIFMWWQLKRSRLLGTVVIALSVVTATVMYFCVHDFYATTRL